MVESLMARRHPPLPFVIRLVLWPLRIVLTLASLAAVLLTLFVSTWGEPGLRTGSLLTILGFTLLVWIHPMSRWLPAVLAGLALVSVFAGNVIGGLVVLVLVAFIWWQRRTGKGTLPLRLDRMTPVGLDETMIGARKTVQQFEKLGFARAGAYRTPIGFFPTTVTLLLSEDRMSYASVTDAVVHVTSVFPEHRALVTRNHDVMPLPPYLLANSESGAPPAELVQSHHRSLSLVAERDHHPNTLDAAELTEVAMESERRVKEWIGAGRPNALDTSGRLWERGGRYQQIDDWHAAASTDPSTSDS